jgi:uncharacterized protein (DUF4415 family)
MKGGFMNNSNQEKENDDIPTLTKEQLKRFRPITDEEHEGFRKGLEAKFGTPFPSKLGRPRKHPHDKYVGIFIKVNPKVLAWFKARAERLHVGYQSLINEKLAAFAQGAKPGHGHYFFLPDKPGKTALRRKTKTKQASPR